MMQPGVHIETLQKPQRYTSLQLDRAVAIAALLDRGKFVLCEEPKR